MSILDLFDSKKRKLSKITIRKANISDVDEIYNLIETIYNGMEHKEWYSYTKKKERYNLFINDGYCYVACYKDKIIGYFLTYILREDGTDFYKLVTEHYGNNENIIEVINYGILPDYRGLGLQEKMLMQLENDVKGTEGKHFVVTIHPDNKYSLNNMIKRGYNIIITTKLYGGLDRHILTKNID